MDYAEPAQPQRLVFKMGDRMVSPKKDHGGDSDPLTYSSFTGGHQNSTGQDLAKGSCYTERLRKHGREFLKNNPSWLAVRQKLKAKKEEKRLRENARQHKQMVQKHRDAITSEERRKQGLEIPVSSSSSHSDSELASVE